MAGAPSVGGGSGSPGGTNAAGDTGGAGGTGGAGETGAPRFAVSAGAPGAAGSLGATTGGAGSAGATQTGTAGAAGAPTNDRSHFITVCKTDNPGTSSDDQITLPLLSEGTYDFIVSWGDGTADEITSRDSPARTHTYAAAGTYSVDIVGVISGWQFMAAGVQSVLNGEWEEESGDARKLEEVVQWGSLSFGATNSQFSGAEGAATVQAADPAASRDHGARPGAERQRFSRLDLGSHVPTLGSSWRDGRASRPHSSPLSLHVNTRCTIGAGGGGEPSRDESMLFAVGLGASVRRETSQNP